MHLLIQLDGHLLPRQLSTFVTVLVFAGALGGLVNLFRVVVVVADAWGSSALRARLVPGSSRRRDEPEQEDPSA